MKVTIEPGRYVVGVSGGVDSMVLLDLLSNTSGLSLVVAHFDHGIRKESKKDASFVNTIAKNLALPYELGQAKLGPKASEDQARQKRYEFLESIRRKYWAKAIITAHHQDDLLETAVINLLRGTGWRGLVAIKRNKGVIRPMLGFTKKQILEYAHSRKIKWREDKTNIDPKYFRNRVRSDIIPFLPIYDRRRLLKIINDIERDAPHIEMALKHLSKTISATRSISRRQFKLLPVMVADELLVYWLRKAGVQDLSRPMITRLGISIKNGRMGTKHNVLGDLWVVLDQEKARLVKDKNRG